MAAILEHNNRGNESYTQGLNAFADLTIDERLARLTGAEPFVLDPGSGSSNDGDASGAIGGRRLRGPSTSFITGRIGGDEDHRVEHDGHDGALTAPLHSDDGLHPASTAAAERSSGTGTTPAEAGARRLANPASVDWSTDATLMNPIKNQGQCGSCELRGCSHYLASSFPLLPLLVLPALSS